jgi:hypothetical protein
LLNTNKKGGEFMKDQRRYELLTKILAEVKAIGDYNSRRMASREKLVSFADKISELVLDNASDCGL